MTRFGRMIVAFISSLSFCTLSTPKEHRGPAEDCQLSHREQTEVVEGDEGGQSNPLRLPPFAAPPPDLPDFLNSMLFEFGKQKNIKRFLA